jgi:hypothetical protein
MAYLPEQVIDHTGCTTTQGYFQREDDVYSEDTDCQRYFRRQHSYLEIDFFDSKTGGESQYLQY